MKKIFGALIVLVALYFGVSIGMYVALPPTVRAQVNTFCAANLACTVTANWTFSGTTMFSGPSTHSGTETFANINATRFVSAGNPQGWAGSDAGAWINAAIQNLPAAPVGGEVDVSTNPAGCYSFTTPIVIDRPVHFKGQIGGYNGLGTCLSYTGGAFPVISAITASGATTGTLIENLSIITGGTCTWAIDINNNQIGLTLDNVWVDSKGIACTGGGFRVGSASVPAPPQNIVFNRVHVFNQPIGIQLLSVNSFDCWSCISAENTTSNLQVGDGSNDATNVTFHGGDFEQDSTTVPSIVVNNVVGLYFYGPYTETFGGDWLTVPSTATTALGIHIYGGRFQFNGQTSNAFHLNFSGAEISVDGGVAVSPGAGSNWINNQSANFAHLSNLTSASGNISFVTGAGTTYYDIGETNGVIIPPSLPSNTIVQGTFHARNAVSDAGLSCTNGELALSAGWQSTGSATVTAVQGNGQTCSWTITTGTTTAASPTVTDSLTNAFPAATTVCEMNIHGGTHTAVAGEGFTQTTLSAAVPVFTFIGTPGASGVTYFVTRRCGP